MDVPVEGDRVAVPYGVNEHWTFIPARAVGNHNVGADDGAPVGARDADLVYLEEPAAVRGPVGIVWGKS